MKPIQHYIYSLLFDYEYVTIPDFGSFITHYLPATIQQDKTLKPSSKKVAFNALLKTDDGILVSHIAQNEGISKTDAAQKLELFVLESLQELHINQHLHWVNIGSFQLNAENKIEFYPINNANFLGDTFGLQEISINPLFETPNKSIVFEEATEDVRQQIEERRKRNKVLDYSLYALPFVLLLSAVMFVSKQAKNSSDEASIAPINSSQIFEVSKPSSIPEQKVTEAINNKIGRFYIVTSCFKDKENAESQLNNLRRNGFAESYLLFPEEEGKLIKVVAAEVETENEASKLVNDLKKISGENPVVLQK